MVASQVKDYYKILGIERTADEKAIKAAFRKLARTHHPDKNPDDPAAEERFKEINEAFNILSDNASRKLYDRYGSDWERYRDAGFTGDEPVGRPSGPRSAEFDSFFTTGGPGGYQRVETDLDPSTFQDLLGSFFGRRGTDRFETTRTLRRKGEDLEVGIDVSFDEAFKGTSRRIDIQAPETCSTCGGVGFVRGQPCPTCDATGEALTTKRLEVKIPAGVATGSRVRIKGQGGPGAGGAPAGDVWINVTVRPDPRFERAGDDLKTEIEVPLYTAVLGGEVTVPTPTGRVALAIPAGSQNGRVFRLRGQGMPKLKAKGRERGDLLARIKIAIPTSLDDRERRLFEELRALQR